jgi:hypothetical protein
LLNFLTKALSVAKFHCLELQMKSLLVAAFSLVLASSIAANVELMRANKELSAELNRKTTVPLGVVLPPLEGEDLSGKQIRVAADNPGHPTVLFVFSPICHFCASNWPKWTSMLSSEVQGGWRPVFVNVGIPSTRDFQKSHGIDHYITLDKITAETQLAYRLSVTPETIVLNSEGKAVKMWVGELSPEDVSGFSRTLSTLH